MSREIEETLDMKAVRTNMVRFFNIHMAKSDESWEVGKC